ncbi:lysylphosphatidylglycerol synthase transmembrane domain-containing protein [Sorangium atrum]|uniref:Lysylphosphatidylglycerol synthase transmembrane domain-containing protein n=1 Tax=Sorangium atrum TaxID=2995308 RepID=A0ABT5CAR9_9BACT|nr:lysylphosphatidylglycerol synthase transmembrane domain-containing protein [Sorangium aterium]MDC0683518.1 lysylphosphatidylglycerol synthase transmembrane domain-containing protein [Sorangium aterium]
MAEPAPVHEGDARAPRATPAAGNLARRRALGLLGSLVVAGCFVWLMRAGTLPVVPAAEHLARVPAWVPVAYGAVWLLVLTLRAMRWYWLLRPLRPVSMRRVLTVSFIGYGALLLLPFRMGELVRPALIRQQGGISGWAATGSVGAERVLDGLYLSALLFAALQIARPLDPLPDRIGELQVSAAVVPGAAYTALAVFFAGFVTMGVFYWRRAWARRTTERVVGLVSPRLGVWLADRVEHVADGLRFLPRFRYTGPFLAVTVVYWAVNAAGIWMVCRGAGVTGLTFGQACVVMGVLALGVLVPNAPGFFGAFQISVYAGLSMYISPRDVVGPGSAAVFWLYVLQVGVTFLGAGAALLIERISPKDALAAAGDRQAEAGEPGAGPA